MQIINWRERIIITTVQDNNLERAADWVFSHAGDLDAMETDQPAAGGGQETAANYHDGPGSKHEPFFLISDYLNKTKILYRQLNCSVKLANILTRCSRG